MVLPREVGVHRVSSDPCGAPGEAILGCIMVKNTTFLNVVVPSLALLAP